MNKIIPILLLAFAPVFLVSCRQKNQAEGVTSITLGQLPISYSAVTEVAMERDLYHKYKLDVHLFSIPAGPDMVAALRVNGSSGADVGTIAITPPMTMIAAGDHPVIIAQTLVSSHQVKLVSYKNTGINDDPVSLKGKRVGVVKGTNGEIYFSRLLAKGHIAASELEIVNGRPADLKNLLVQGAIDAMIAWDPFTIQAERDYLTRRLAHTVPDRGDPTSFIDPTLHTLSFNIVTTKEKLEKHRPDLIKLLRAAIEAGDYIEANHAQSQQLLESWLKLDRGDLSNLMETSSFKVHLDRTQVQRWLAEELDWYRSVRPDAQIPKDYAGFVDESLLREISADRVK